MFHIISEMLIFMIQSTLLHLYVTLVIVNSCLFVIFLCHCKQLYLIVGLIIHIISQTCIFNYSPRYSICVNTETSINYFRMLSKKTMMTNKNGTYFEILHTAF